MHRARRPPPQSPVPPHWFSDYTRGSSYPFFFSSPLSLSLSLPHSLSLSSPLSLSFFLYLFSLFLGRSFSLFGAYFCDSLRSRNFLVISCIITCLAHADTAFLQLSCGCTPCINPAQTFRCTLLLPCSGSARFMKVGSLFLQKLKVFNF